MIENFVSFLVLQILFVTAQHSPYSLQTAVDALHRREAQLALRDYENSKLTEDGYYDEGDIVELRKQQELNKLLARYLDREGARDHSPYDQEFADEDYDGPDERKRSMFRERDENPYQSVFRERGIDYNQPDLAVAFLKEIDHGRNVEREQQYKENLRKLWKKYQAQENKIEQYLFDEGNQRSPTNYLDNNQQFSNDLSHQYVEPVIEKRRLILPWLPASRRKRFPVSKRSPKYTNIETSASGTNEKVAKDLQAIFGKPIDDKRKRSTNEQIETTKTEHKIEKKSDHSTSDDDNVAQDQSQHYDDYQKDHGADLTHSHDHDGDDDEFDHDHEHEHGHDMHDDDDDDSDFEDDDDDEKAGKHKTEAKRSNPEILKEDQIIPGDLTDFKRKKSIQWSKYFGIDRRKKSGDDWFMNKYKSQMGKQFSEEYPVRKFHDQNTERNKIELNKGKLENMDNKLKTIEDLIIDETVKYTGSHEGMSSNPEDIQRLKDHVISRLATAYSLEKMRIALNKLKQSVENEEHIEKNLISKEKKQIDVEKDKRVAIKKEKVQFDNNHHPIESSTEKVVNDVLNNAIDIPDKKKKKIITQKMYADYIDGLEKNKNKNIDQGPYPDYNELSDFEEELGAGHFEPLNEGYLSGKSNFRSNHCPLLDAMEKRCRGVDILSGDIHQDLLPLCGIHQICYLCGTSQTSCDFQYLSESDGICGHNKECQSAARSVLMILRGSPGHQLGPRECAKNACLSRAMRDIGL